MQVNLSFAVHQDLAGDTELHFTETLSRDIDVLFLCVGHGEARKFLQDNQTESGHPAD